MEFVRKLVSRRTLDDDKFVDEMTQDNFVR